MDLENTLFAGVCLYFSAWKIHCLQVCACTFQPGKYIVCRCVLVLFSLENILFAGVCLYFSAWKFSRLGQ